MIVGYSSLHLKLRIQWRNSSFEGWWLKRREENRRQQTTLASTNAGLLGREPVSPNRRNDAGYIPPHHNPSTQCSRELVDHPHPPCRARTTAATRYNERQDSHFFFGSLQRISVTAGHNKSVWQQFSFRYSRNSLPEARVTVLANANSPQSRMPNTNPEIGMENNFFGTIPSYQPHIPETETYFSRDHCMSTNQRKQLFIRE